MTRNKYVDGTVPPPGYDIVQPKYDGWFCRAVSDGNRVEYYSDTDRLFHKVDVELPACVLYGEYMRGTQWSKDPSRYGRFYVFDILSQGSAENRRDLAQVEYAARYRTLLSFAPVFPVNYSIVPCYKMENEREVWKAYVETQGFEGLIYRRSNGLVGDTIIRNKKVLTMDGVVVGYIPGTGKHVGRMGALEVRLPDGTVTRIGNGWSDADRIMLASSGDAETVLGKTLEFETNKVFDSGNVRHGRFVRWRTDR